MTIRFLLSSLSEYFFTSPSSGGAASRAPNQSHTVAMSVHVVLELKLTEACGSINKRRAEEVIIDQINLFIVRWNYFEINDSFTLFQQA